MIHDPIHTRQQSLLQSIFEPIFQHEGNRLGQILRGFFGSAALSVGLGHFRAKSGKPLAIGFNRSGVSIAHERKIIDRFRADKFRLAVLVDAPV